MFSSSVRKVKVDCQSCPIPRLLQRLHAAVMDFPGIPLLLLLGQTCAAMELYISPTQRTFRGSNVVLGCTFSVDNPSAGPSFFIIKWYFKSKEILTYDNGGLSLQPRMSFNDQAARGGDASLYISNVSIFDDGTYTCSVKYNMERKEKDTQLQIMASPKVLITNKVVTESKASTMTCTATEFFPPDIRVTWLRGDQRLQNSEMGEITPNDDWTFSVKSTVIITPSDEDRERIFSCRVQHASLPEPKRVDFQLDIRNINIGLYLGIGGAIFVCLITVLGIWCYRRSKSAPQPQTVQHQEYAKVDQLHTTEEPVQLSTQEELNMVDYQHQHPPPQEANMEEKPGDIRHNPGTSTDLHLPPTGELNAEELDGFEIIDFSEVPHYL
ncbi:natural cytotoxicity triggering receptor 3 ligand 1-like isoform X2 [Lithobates pipiens]